MSSAIDTGRRSRENRLLFFPRRILSAAIRRLIPGPVDGNSDAMTLDEITALFFRRDEDYERQDAAALVSDYADDCVVESAIAGLVVGRVAVEEVFRSLFLAFPDFSFRTQELLISGNDRVVQTAIVRGIDNGGFMGLPPTGRPFTVSIVFLYTLSGNQIVRERRTYDFARMLLQLAGDTEPATEGPRLYRQTMERVRLDHEMKTAAAIQRALLPEARHAGPNFEVGAASVPCRAIGGDFFDYFDLANGTFGFALGDVAGKGPPAALLAAELQGVLAVLSESASMPADLVSRVNQVLVRRAVESRFVTLLYGVLSPDGRLTYCNAGHNPPFLLGRRGMRRLETGGLILGAFKGAAFQEESLQLDPGDLLVMFSDGVTEALNADGAEFGEDQLLACVRWRQELPAAGILESVLETVGEFTAGAAQSDDLTALVLRYTGT
jgi:steroid delta-isomerase-like uncharacterized protein